MNPTVEQPAAMAGVQLPEDVLRTPSGEPAAVVVRTTRGWTVLGSEDPGLTLVEGMSLADLIAAELGISPEPNRAARRAARNGGTPIPDAPSADPRDEELAALRRTVGQLEHALAARVSIERAIGVLAERHGRTLREAFEELRCRARSQGRPAQELAAGSPVPGQCTAGPTVLASPDAHPAVGQPSPRRVQRNGRRPAGDPVPRIRS